MRNLPLLTLAIAVAAVTAVTAVAACEQSGTPTLAGIGGTPNATSGTDTTAALVISPSQAQMAVGATLQLSTNAPFAQQTQVQWSSLQPTIATISPFGLVTAIAPGTATITARYAFDTTRVATATVVVSGTAAGGVMPGSGSQPL